MMAAHVLIEVVEFRECGIRMVTRSFVMLLVLCSAIQVVLADGEKKAERTQDEVADERWFELFVRDSKGKPIPHAVVEFRGGINKKPEQFPVGTFHKKGRYGVFVKPDKFGRLIFVPEQSNRAFSISIKASGFGPYHARYDLKNWTAENSLQLIAELDDGWTVAGRVIDEQGNPVQGAEVAPSIEYKKAPGMNYQLGVGERRITNKDGTWKLDLVPVSNSDLRVTINHPDFKPERKELPRSIYEWNEETPDKFEAIPVSRGIVVTGRVTDTAGKPIAGALIRSKFVNEIRQATTRVDGTYTLAACEAGQTRIVVSAKGKATDLKEVRLRENPEPVDFVMQPGGHVRIVVQDEKGNPLPKARIFYQKWRGSTNYFEFDFKNQYADEHGVWEWNEAPVDEFYVDVCRPGGMQLSKQKILARAEEYVFSPPPALVITGKVINAEAKEPVNTFRVTPGVFFGKSPHLLKRDSFDGAKGKYHIKRQDGYQSYFVRIEAPGFLAKESRAIDPDEGQLKIDFELQPVKQLTPIVLDPQGKPTPNCQVAIGVAGSQIDIQNGHFDIRNTNALTTRTDQSGRFRFTPQAKFSVVILSDSGFAYLQSVNGGIPENIKLLPWSSVQGTFRVGDQVQPKVRLELNTMAIHSFENDAPRIHTRFYTTTKADGSYAFDRVFPGRASIHREMIFMVNEGATEMTSQKRTPLDIFAGENLELNLGGDGVAVTGQFVAPAEFQEQPRWRFARIELVSIAGRPDPPSIPEEIQEDFLKKAEWVQTWRESKAGVQYEAQMMAYQQKLFKQPRYYVSASDDGKFRIDDVSPGKYEISFRGDTNLPFKHSATIFTVPEKEPINLGKLSTEPIR